MRYSTGSTYAGIQSRNRFHGSKYADSVFTTRGGYQVRMLSEEEIAEFQRHVQQCVESRCGQPNPTRPEATS